ncbi:MAG: DUF4252 domain-containing protein [Bacteroidota bacterium]|nr:DUF4252 domain-containing protein [Bacteroidota bacterium]
MRKIFLTLVGVIFAATLTMAQSPMDKLFTKYAGQEGFTSVNISSEMFAMFADMNIDTEKISDESGKAAVEAMSQLNGMKILTYSKSSDRKLDFVKEINSAFDLSKFKELMTIKEKDSDVKFLVKKKGKKVTHLLMIADGKNEVVLMNLTGLIDMANIAKLSSQMNIKGMENLEKIEEKE